MRRFCLGDPAPVQSGHGSGWTQPGGEKAAPTYRPLPQLSTVPGSGPRPGGRRAEEMRPCHFQVGATLNSSGSAYVENGATKVLAAVFGPRQPWERLETLNEGVLNVEVQYSAFASRNPGPAQAARCKLYSSLLQSALESTVLLERYAKSMIDVHLLVLEDDGAALTTAVGAASLALADAAIDMRDIVVGSTVHLAKNSAGSTLLLDCDAAEEAAMPDGSAVLHLGLCPTRGAVCLMHSVGPVPPDSFEQMVLLAKDTAEATGAEMRRCLDDRCSQRRAKRQRQGGGARGAVGMMPMMQD